MTTDAKDRLTELQEAYADRGDEVFDELRKEDPETYALVLAEAAWLLSEEGNEDYEDETEEAPQRVNVYCKYGETEARALARFYCKPEFLAASSILRLTRTENEPADINELIVELESQTKRLRDDSGRIESMLNAQSHTLDAMFNNLMLRALTNIEGGSSEVGRDYFKLAMKAQSQCRATADSLAAIRRPVIKQTNIAHGHQQVNNNVSTDNQIPPNELKDDQDGERMDTRATQETVTSDQDMETVGEEHGTEDG